MVANINSLSIWDRQEDCLEFKASLSNTVYSRLA